MLEVLRDAGTRGLEIYDAGRKDRRVSIRSGGGLAWRRALAAYPVCAAIALALAAVGPARAQEPEPSPSPSPSTSPSLAPREAPPESSAIDRIEVQGETLGELADATSFATVIEIHQQAEEFKTVAQVLSETVGLQVRSFGGLGDFATVSVRGASAGQVRIYFDDVPLTRARSDTVNLADLPLEPLARIDVYRGVTPLSVGASALGGVINLVTKDPGEEPTVALLFGGGSFGTRQGSVTTSTRRGDLGFLGSFNYLGSEGDFPFDDDNGTPLNPFDDERVRRENNQFNSGDAILKAIWDLSPTSRIVGLNELFINEQGVPGIGALTSKDASLYDFRNLSYVRFESDDTGSLPEEIDSTLFFIYEEERFTDLMGDIGPGNQSSRNRSFAGGANVHGVQPLGAHLLEARLDVGGEVFVPRNLLDPEPQDPNQSRISFNVGVGDTWSLLEDSLLLDGQLRYELASDDFGDITIPSGEIVDAPTGGTNQLFTPRLGARWLPWNELALKMNVGRYGRIPSFFELFGNRGFVLGNPNLKPEQGVNVDVGFEARPLDYGFLTRSRGEAVFFWRSVDDLIVLEQNSQQRSIFRNLASAEILGVELSAATVLWENLGVTANYTYQDARDESGGAADGNQIPGLPRNEGYARIDWDRWDAVPFYELIFASGNFVDTRNLREIPSRTVHTLGLRYTLPRTPLTLTFEALNITNNQIEDVAGFPLPGLSFFGTVAYRWVGAT